MRRKAFDYSVEKLWDEIPAYMSCILHTGADKAFGHSGHLKKLKVKLRTLAFAALCVGAHLLFPLTIVGKNPLTRNTRQT